MRRDCAKSGSEASRFMAASLSPLALGAGRTVGPGCCGANEGGGGGAGVLVVADASGERAGYFRAAEPAALAALEDAEPIPRDFNGQCSGKYMKDRDRVSITRESCTRALMMRSSTPLKHLHFLSYANSNVQEQREYISLRPRRVPSDHNHR